VTQLLGLSGSLRAGSFNTALLHAAQARLPPGVTLEVATLHGIPLYDADLEAREGIPPAVTALKEQIVASDGVLLATPEYNNGIPGVFKNAIDWLSRPPGGAARIFRDRPFAVIGASPGGFGTILAQNAWLPVLRTLGARHWSGGRLMVSRASQVFDAQGAIADPKLAEQLQQFVAGFAGYASAAPTVLERWYALVATHTLDALDDLLADDVVFQSPAVHTPQVGKAITKKYLVAAMTVLDTGQFRYVGEWHGEQSAVLEFETAIGDVQVNGVDMIEWNASGQITKFKVMVRPVKALQALMPLMAQALQGGAAG
jgi:NAD(P)H-dependent FMN reductase/ketosteroid isomerase-like protein